MLQEQCDPPEGLLAELEKLDPAEERALAEEWLVAEVEWPDY